MNGINSNLSFQIAYQGQVSYKKLKSYGSKASQKKS